MSTIHTPRRQGKVWLVGFGPGDPELLTCKAHRILGEADVLFHDALVPAAHLAVYPGRKRAVGKRDHTEQAGINTLLLEAAQRGECVARVKIGDPMLFGRGGEELAFLRAHGVAVEVVPGVSAAQAAAAVAEVPLTLRGVAQRLELRTGHGCAAATPERPTVVYYMGAARLAVIAAELLAEGHPVGTPVALVENATRPEQRIVHTTLAELAQQSARAPLTLIVGDVVRGTP